jgi:hypothetical protein
LQQQLEQRNKPELNTLDEADFVRDVYNRDSHHQYHFEIVGAKGLLNIYLDRSV